MAGAENVLEFNSNVDVLQRTSNIISAINDARFRTTQFDDYGIVRAEPEEVLSHMICLYKEVRPEMKDTDAKTLWDKLSKLRDKLRVRPPRPSIEMMSYWRKTIDEIDEIDIELRLLAKKHGFLSANKKNVSKAALRRG